MVDDFQRSLPVSSERVDSFCSKAVHEMPLQKSVQNERIVRPIREVNLLLKQVRDRESPGKINVYTVGKTLLVFSYKM